MLILCGTNYAIIKVCNICCQRDLESTHCTLSHLSCRRVSMRWKGCHCCSPSLGLPPRHWDSQKLGLNSQPGTQTLGLPDTMEQFLDWGQTSPWAPVITFLGVASCLRISFGLIRSLRDLLWAYVLPRIWPVDLVKTYGKWVDPISLKEKRCN